MIKPIRQSRDAPSNKALAIIPSPLRERVRVRVKSRKWQSCQPQSRPPPPPPPSPPPSPPPPPPPSPPAPPRHSRESGNPGMGTGAVHDPPPPSPPPPPPSPRLPLRHPRESGNPGMGGAVHDPPPPSPPPPPPPPPPLRPPTSPSVIPAKAGIQGWVGRCTFYSHLRPLHRHPRLHLRHSRESGNPGLGRGRCTTLATHLRRWFLRPPASPSPSFPRKRESRDGHRGGARP